jgi:hypothetical protein
MRLVILASRAAGCRPRTIASFGHHLAGNPPPGAPPFDASSGWDEELETGKG